MKHAESIAGICVLSRFLAAILTARARRTRVVVVSVVVAFAFLSAPPARGWRAVKLNASVPADAQVKRPAAPSEKLGRYERQCQYGSEHFVSTMLV